MKPLQHLAVLYSQHTAHVALGRPRGQATDFTVGAAPCQLVVSYGQSMSLANYPPKDLAALSQAFAKARDGRKLCTACATYLIAVRAVVDAEAFRQETAALTRAAVTVTAADVTDLYEFDPADIAARALSAVTDRLTGFSPSQDDDYYHYLSAAMYGSQEVRATYATEIDKLKAIMLTSLRDAGYDV